MTRTILLTGATGFLGRAIAERLAERGVHTIGFARAHNREGMELASWVDGDLGDAAAVDRALGRAKEAAGGMPFDVVHGGAVISYRRGDGALQERINVGGTRHVVEACVRHGARRLCLVSSVVAVGPAPGPEVAIDEDAPFDGARLGCDYVTTKRAAEELALAAPPGLEVVAACPGAIFGSSPRASNTQRFVREALGGLLLFAPPGGLSVVGLEDAAEGVVLALERGRDRRRYLLCESNWRLAELIQLVRELAGRPPRRPATIPRWLWRVVIAAAGLVDRVRVLEKASPQALRLLGEHFRYDASRARDELGWSPRPFREVLAALLAERDS